MASKTPGLRVHRAFKSSSGERKTFRPRSKEIGQFRQSRLAASHGTVNSLF